MHETLQLDKLEGVDYRYDTFLEIPVQRPNRAYLVIFFGFGWNFIASEIRGH